MQSLLTDMLIQASCDFEKTKYEIQAKLKKKRDAFDLKLLYPDMLEISEIYRELRKLDENKDVIFDGLKKKADIKLFDYIDTIIKREGVTNEFRKKIMDVMELAQWAYPRVEEIRAIGNEILLETAESIEIDWVNIISTYLDEGYLIISAADEESEGDLRVFSYERIKFIEDPNDPMYTLRTKPKSVDSSATEPEQLKRDLLSARTNKERNTNPNPATIFLDISVPYSFPKTGFPVAKQSLLRWFRLQEDLNF